ncbi:MAG TPA: alcohol dehydrogenase catalytic domain-containing protein, partial [Vicinamibacteria bacterium]|nr:alcohol dehydrogenase catalytic domain-containing protein [Vicinamibacteria bacterium]
MRALQVTELSGPQGVELVDLPEPEQSHMFTPGEGVVVEVAAAAVSFPDVLQSRGLYQFKPDPPFVPGAEVAGIVRSASEGAAVSPGDRVAAFTGLSGWAELAVAPPHMTFPLPDELDFAEGA